MILVPQSQTFTTFENSYFYIDCGSGYSISVISGVYGRFNTVICYYICSGCYLVMQTGCSITTTSIFSSWFNGKSKMNQTVSNAVIGTDPCVGTWKYSQIVFQCV